MPRKTCGGTRLALEALDELCLLSEIVGEDLGRHGAAQGRVLGCPDRRHSTSRDQACDAVAIRKRNPIAIHDFHLPKNCLRKAALSFSRCSTSSRTSSRQSSPTSARAAS